jgi:hypothetical protein
MTYEEVLEVVSINPASDAHKGTSLYQVTFGTYGKIMPGIITGAIPPDAEIASNKMILYMPKHKECQYKVGSKWLIRVEDTGAISITESK